MLQIEAMIFGDITYENIVDIAIYLEAEQEEMEYEAIHN
jgi:hypothetical protein